MSNRMFTSFLSKPFNAPLRACILCAGLELYLSLNIFGKNGAEERVLNINEGFHFM